MTVFEKIITLLNQHNIVYELKEHAPTPTSEDSARERGESIKIGAKALVVKTKKGFFLCVVPGDQKLDTKKFRKLIGSSTVRFATKEELLELTGLIPGSVPPFGPVLGLEMVVEKRLFDEDYMAFNAGELTKSIKMKTADYRRLLEPRIEEIT